MLSQDHEIVKSWSRDNKLFSRDVKLILRSTKNWADYCRWSVGVCCVCLLTAGRGGNGVKYTSLLCSVHWNVMCVVMTEDNLGMIPSCKVRGCASLFTLSEGENGVCFVKKTDFVISWSRVNYLVNLWKRSKKISQATVKGFCNYLKLNDVLFWKNYRFSLLEPHTAHCIYPPHLKEQSLKLLSVIKRCVVQLMVVLIRILLFADSGLQH